MADTNNNEENSDEFQVSVVSKKSLTDVLSSRETSQGSPNPDDSDDLGSDTPSQNDSSDDDAKSEQSAWSTCSRSMSMSVSRTFYSRLPRKLRKKLDESEKNRIISNIQSYLMLLTKHDIEQIVEANEIVYERLDGFVGFLMNSLKNDDDLAHDKVFQSLISWRIIKQILNSYIIVGTMIQQLYNEVNDDNNEGSSSLLAALCVSSHKDKQDTTHCQNENNGDNNHDDDDDDHDDEDEDAEHMTPFEELIAYLLKIGVAHDKHDVNYKYLTVIRSHVIKGFRNEFGVDWNVSLENSWIKFSNFLCVGITAATKLSKDSLATPSDETFQTVIESWNDIKTGMKLFLEKFWQELASDANNSIRFFPTPRSIHGIIKFTFLTNYFQHKDALVDKLRELGKIHAERGVNKKNFTAFLNCWLTTVKKVSGIKYTEHLQDAWRQVLFFLSRTMIESLEEVQMLELQHDPKSIKLHAKLVHLGDIVPETCQFECDIDIAASCGNKPRLVRHIAEEIASHYEADEQNQNTGSTAATSNLTNRRSQLRRQGSVVATSKNEASVNANSLKWKLKLENCLYTEEQYKKHGKVRHIKLTDGSIYQRNRMVGSFIQVFDMQAFPFDKHLLKFHVSSNCSAAVAKIDPNEIEVELGDASVPEGEDVEIGGSDWVVHKPFAECYNVMMCGDGTSKCLSSAKVSKLQLDRNTYSRQCVIVVPITRRWSNFLPQVFFPMQIMDFIAFCTYNTSPIPSIYNRFEFIAVLVGCLLAFRYTIDRNLPRVPYLTHLDYHFNFAYLMLLFHALWAGVLIQDMKNKGTYSEQVDFAFFIVAALLYCAGKFYLCKTGYNHIQSMQQYSDPENVENLKKLVTMDPEDEDIEDLY